MAESGRFNIKEISKIEIDNTLPELKLNKLQDLSESEYSMLLGPYKKDVQKLCENKDFIEKFRKGIEELHTIQEWIEVLDPRQKQKDWEKKIDENLEKLEISEEFSEYIIEIEKIRDIVKYFYKTVQILPIIAKILQYNISYFLELLNYGRLTRLSDYSSFGGDHMIFHIVNKIMKTVYHVNFMIITVEMEKFGNKSPSFPLWSLKEEENKDLSKQAFTEFKEYLEEKDFFKSEENPSTQCLIS